MINVTGKGIAIGTAAAVGLYLFAKGEIRTALKSVNPVDRENVFNQGAQSVGKAVTGDKYFNLGSYLFEVFNPSAVAREEEILGPGQTGDGRVIGPTGYEPPPERDLRRLGTSLVKSR